MTWQENLARSKVAVVIMGPDFYGTNGPDILAEAISQEKWIILMVPQDRDGPVPPQFEAYGGRKAQINIASYDPGLILRKTNEQCLHWGVLITEGYEHTWKDLPGPL